jgi:cytoskeletal protein CcmA (bactofilin family)
MINPNQSHKYGQPAQTALGQAMPDVLKTPVLTQVEPHEAATAVSSTSISNSSALYASAPNANHKEPGKAGKLCMIEEGVTFTGNAALQGTCTIAGQLIGNLKEQTGATSQIVITETGSVKGDIFSHKVSVMGACSGTIDASGGNVDLHAKSVVSGHIRYGQLQVNGADLNATLERVAKPVDKVPEKATDKPVNKASS